MNQVINVQPIDEWYMYIVLFLYLLKGVWFGHATSKAFLSSSMSNYLLALEFLIGHHTHLEYIHVHAFFYKKDALPWHKFAIALCTHNGEDLKVPEYSACPEWRVTCDGRPKIEFLICLDIFLVASMIFLSLISEFRHLNLWVRHEKSISNI